MEMEIEMEKNGNTEDHILLEPKAKKKFQYPLKTPDEIKQEKENRKKRRARIIIRNISYNSTEANLTEYFSKFGKIQELNLLKRTDGKLVGCAFIQYEQVNQAAKAILKCTGKEFLGRPIHIDWSVDKDKYNKHVRQKNKLKPPVDDDNISVKSEPISVKAEEDIKVEHKSDNSESDNSEDETDHEDENDEDEDKKDIKQEHLDGKLPRRVSNDVSEGCTVFIKNIPFDATNEDLKNCCKQFGPIYYGLINIDSVSRHSKGTGFVKFQRKESANMCLSAGTEFKLLDNILDPRSALSRNDIKTKYNLAHQKEPADTRNLYLVKEGLIVASSSAAEGVSTSDMAQRLRLEQIKTQMLKNLNRFLSRERLTIHNIPAAYDSVKLRSVVQAATKLKPKECRVMREVIPSVGNPLGKSKGFGFISFKNHQDALMCLRKLNNNPNVFGKHNRPIVSFSIEDKSVHNIKQKRLQKSLEKNPLFQDKKARRKQKRKEKRMNRQNNDDKTSIQQTIQTNLKKKSKKNKQKQTITTEPLEFSGAIGEPGVGFDVRPKWKLREQATLHNKDVSTVKKDLRKQKQQRQLQQEKREVDRTKKRKTGNQVDNFSFMVDKYKRMLDSTDKSNSAKKIKRSKWYVE